MKQKPIDMFYGASPAIFEKARVLRENLTDSEKLLWKKLSNNRLGFRFKSQHPIGIYIADFYCHKLKLVIEVDGEIHNSLDSKEYDANRDRTLREFGITILRFTNAEVVKEMENVLKVIFAHLSSFNP